MFLTRSNKKITAVLLTLSALLLSTMFFSCQKELSGLTGGNLNPGTPPDLTTKVNSNISGFVTDENNAPVLGATVQAGTAVTTTDKFGYFEVKNAQVVKNAALVTVNKPGYFKGIKTYSAEEGKKAFFRIQLIPKTNVGNVDAATGGTVTVVNGLSVKLPANGIVKADGSAYTGQVNVAAYWIDPTAFNLNRIMPGDLRGINTEGLMKTLTTYGMAAIELTGAGGEVLNIATGSKATLTFPIPASQMSAAPSSLPLWYMDESTGLWKEQGTATKTGNTYVGDVNHFSFWNCDVPASYVPISMTIVNAAQQPVANAVVKISEVGNPLNSRSGWTDSSGYVTGLVPDSSQLLVEVYADWNCGAPSVSQNVTTLGSAVNLGNIIVGAANVAVITGTVTDCNNAPVANGYVMVQNGYYGYHVGLSPTGTYSFNTAICAGAPSVVTILGVDVAGTQQSNPTTVSLVGGNNTVPNISACGTTIAEFFNYTLNGVTYAYSAPTDSLYQYLDQQSIGTPSHIISANAYNAGTSTYATLGFAATGAAVGSAQDITLIFISPVQNDTLTATPAVQVNITEFGAIDQFIAGNFSGTFTGSVPPNATYTMSGSFRVRRRM